MLVGPRHFDTVMHLQFARLSTLPKVEFDQGFIDQHGVFMSRQEAWTVAQAAGQVINRCGGDTADGGTLYSENLY